VVSDPRVLLYLYPDARPPVDYAVQDGSLVNWRVRDAQGQPVLEPTPEQLAAAAASPEYAAWVLDAARRQRMEAVYARTRELEAQGFEFPPGSRQWFGLSAETQTKWLAMMVAINAGMMTLPQPVGVLNNGTYMISDAPTLTAFLTLALGRGKQIAEDEAELWHQVYDAATVEAVAAVADTRQ
jgi:hypothetical protein